MGNVKILAIDDNEDNIVVLKALLSKAFKNAKYISALSGKEGIEICLSEKPDVILLDFEMPEMDGYEVCRLLKTDENTKTIPIVIITAGGTDKESRIKALEWGADAFLTKPVDESELTAQIRAMLRLKKAEDRKLDENERLKRMVEERTAELQNELKERKLAEQALRDSEEKYSILYKDSPDSYLIISDGVFVDCNKATELMMRGERTQIIGKSPDTISPEFQPDGRKSSESAEEKIAYVLQNGKITFEWVHRRFDGTDLYVEVSLSPIMLKGKQHLFTTWRDITKRKIAELLLEEGIELNKSLMQTIPFGMDIVDEHGIVLYQSVNFEEVFGKNGVGCNCWEIYRDNKKQCEDCPLLKGIEIGKTKTIESSNVLGGRIFEISHTGMMFNGKKALLEIFQDVTERKEAEKEHQESLDMLNKLAAQVPGVVYKYCLYTDGSSAFPYSSPGMYDIYEVTPEEVRKDASSVFTRIHPDDFDFIVDSINESARNLTKYHSEFRVILPTKGLRWLLCDAKPERMDDGSTLWYGLITDITDRKLSDIVLKESEERYRSFISQVTEGVYRFECDQPMDITLPLEEQIDFIYDHFFVAECNEAILKMYKLKDMSEMIGKRHLDFHGGRNNELYRELIRKFIRNGYSIQNGITEEYDSNGKPLYVSNNSVGIVENKHLVRTWGTETDITEKIKSEQVQQVLYSISNAALTSVDLSELIEIISNELGTLLNSNNFYIAFYDEKTNMLSTIYEKDEKDVIDTWPAEKSITGYVIKHQKSMLINEEELYRLDESGEIILYGTPSKIWLGVPLNMNKKVIGALVVQSYNDPEAYTEKDKFMLEFVSHQISISIERKKSEQEIKDALVRAQESDRLKSAFLANMSHEIRTPLNSIIGFSDLLLDSDFEYDQQMEFAQMISSSGNSLLAIINDIMDLSKIESGEARVVNKVFSVQQILQDIRKEHSFKAEKKGIGLRIDPFNPIEEIFVESDEQKIRQILVNFVANAIKFTEEGFIDLGIRQINGSVKIQVKDSGIGIPEEFHNTIFERFRQVESAETRKYGGNGLGLAISKSLAEMLGGEVGMESEKGVGSLFYVEIPLLSNQRINSNESLLKSGQIVGNFN